MIRKTLLIIIILFTYLSCGVIIDTGKVAGAWELEKTEYFVYNKITETYKMHKGVKGKKLPLNAAPFGAFFNTNSTKLLLNLSANGEFYIADNSDDTTKYIVEQQRGKWKVDSYENHLELKVAKNPDNNDYGIWSSGVNIKNKWPLADLVSMEILITAETIGRKTISVYGTSLEAAYMKGYFTKK